MTDPNAPSADLSAPAVSVLRSLGTLPVPVDVLDPHMVGGVCDLPTTDAEQVLRELANAGLADVTRPQAEHAAAEYALTAAAIPGPVGQPTPTGGREEVLCRWAEFYLAVATHAEARLTPSHRSMPRTPRYITTVPALEALPDQDLLDWLDRRSTDLQTAVSAVYTARWFDLTTQLVDAMWPLLLRRRNTTLWLTAVGTYGLPAAEKEAARTDLGEQQAEARRMVRRMHTTVGGGLRDAGRLDEALEHYEQAGASALADDHLRDRAQALDGIGAVHQAAGRHQQALAPLEEALRIREEIGYTRGSALTRIRLGEAFSALDRHRAAVEHLLTARIALLQEPDPYDAARALAFMGRTYLRAERFGEGDQHLVSAVKEFEAAGAGVWVARTTEWRAEGAAQRGRIDVAKDQYTRARALYAAAGRDSDAMRIDDAVRALTADQPEP